MRKSRYPLEQVLAQRVRACQQAELELVVARGRLHDAEKALAGAQAVCAQHQSKRTRLVTPTPEQAKVSAQAFAWAGAYAVRLREDGQKLAEQAKAAQTVVSAAARALRLAELSWQRAYAERETLERHHERFKEAERKAAERAYELETEERAHHANILQVRS
ncbi:MAG TPA: hypothetical protein VFN67_16510 [Polyangiales bacterium]|nr:hypothetical protein [Polyangiales bacterium]